MRSGTDEMAVVAGRHRQDFLRKYVNMVVCYIALGANLNDPRWAVQTAADLLAAHPYISDFRLSSLHQTAPVSPIPQPDFINAACRFQTTLAPFELFAFCCRVERQLGKVPKPRDAPRPIDIDILLYGSMQIQTPELEIPHPRFLERPFVLRPLSELCDSLQLSDGRSLLFSEMWDTASVS